MSQRRAEPVVRVRCPDVQDERRCRAALEALGLAPQPQLTWLAVRDASPDAVNDALVAAGARGRVVVRERIGQLVGWLIDREGDLDGRARNVRSLVERVIADGGLKERYAPVADEVLLASARTLYRRILAEGAPFFSWDEFVAAFCAPA